MPRRPHTSRQTRRVLSAFADDPARWWHGYDLCGALGLKSGTLYPILIRLAEDGFLDAEWRSAPDVGRPPRHAYRMTRTGLALAAERRAEDERAAPREGAAGAPPAAAT